MKLPRVPIDLRITLLYALLGGVWILFSDRLLAIVVNDISALTQITIYKGWAFVLVSAALLYALIKHDLIQRESIHKELRESEARYRQLFDSSLDAILLTAPDGRIFAANPSACRMFGQTEAEIVQGERKGITNITDPRLPQALEERARTGKFMGELTMLRSDGTKFPAEIATAIFNNEDGQLRTSMIIRDITERKKADETIQVLARFPSENPNPVLRLTRDGKIEYANPASAPLLEEWNCEVGGSLPSEWKKLIEGQAGHRSRRNVEFVCKERVYSITIVPVEGNDCVNLYGMDITERVQAESEVKKSEETYRQLFENNPHPMWVYGLKSLAFLAVNDAAIAKYGYTRDEFLGMTIADIRPAEDLPRLMENLAQPRRALEHSDGWRHRLKDGTLIDMEISSHTLRFDGHESALVIAQDVTDRKRAEEELRSTTVLLSALLENMQTGILFEDQNRRIALVNQPFYKLFNLPNSTQSLIGMDCRDTAQSLKSLLADTEGFIQKIEGTISQGRMVLGEEINMADGRCLERDYIPITTSDGQAGNLWKYRDITERKRYEEALRESEARYHNTLDTMMEGCQIIDFDWRYIYINDAAARQGHSTSSDLLMHTMMEMYPGIENTELFSVLHHCMENRASRQMENEFKYPDGAVGWFDLSIQPVPEGLFILSIDITERKQAEQALKAAEEKYRTIFDGAVEGIFQSTPDGRFLTANPALARMWGYDSPEEFLSSIYDIAHQIYADPNRRTEYAKLMQEKGKVQGFEFDVYRKDGKIMWVSENARAVRDAEGKLLFYEGNIEDITERKRAETALRESEARLSTIFHTSPVAIAISRLKDNQFTEINDAFQTLTGYKREEIIHRTPNELNLWVNPQERDRLVHELHARNEVRDFEFQLRRKSGEFLDMILSAQLIELGGEQCMLNIAQNITERKTMEIALRQSETKYRKLFSEMLPGCALHEIICDAEGRPVDYVTLDVNHSFEKLLNVRLEDVVGVKASEILPKDELKKWVGIFGPVALEEKSIPYEMYSPLNQKYFEGTAYCPERGKFAVTFTDVTERKQAEDTLRASEERYRDLVENIKDLICTHDLEGHILSVNRAAADLLGYAAEELIGRDMRFLLPPESRREFDEYLAAIQQDQTASGLMSVITKSGEKWTWEYHNTLRTEGVATPLVRGYARDITEQRRAEKALRQSETRYRNLFEDSPISLWEEDFSGVRSRLDSLREQGVTDFRAYFDSHPEAVMECAALAKVTDVNKATLALYKAGKKEDLIKTLAELLKGKPLQSFRDELSNIAEGKTRFGWEGVNKRLDGGLIKINLNWSTTPGSETSLSKVIVSIMDITERKQAEEKVQQQLKRIIALRDIDRVITSSLDLHLTLNRLIAQVTEQLKVSAAAILLFDPYTFTLEYFSGHGFKDKVIPRMRVQLGEDFAGKVALERSTVRVDLTKPIDLPSKNNPLLHQGFAEYFGLPLISKGELRGVLEVFHRTPLDPDADWLDYLDTLAGQAAIAIDNIQMFDGLQRSNLELARAYDATIEGWSRALDMRDKETEGHTQRVTELTVELARAFGLSEKELTNIRWGSLLHDIGKMGVPDAILLKPGPLTDEEWTLMKKHPVFAYEMLSQIQYLHDALDIPHYHHEKWDGTGYPRGLKGEQIPLAARIFAVVDIWDAVRSDRPYRPAWTKAKALNYIKGLSGTHLDPQIVKKFFESKIHQEKRSGKGT